MSADAGTRVPARIIDGVLVVLFLFLTDTVALLIAGHKVTDGAAVSISLDPLPLAALDIAQTVTVVGHEVLGLGLWGQTVGHRVLKLNVVALDGGRPGLVRGARRFGVSVLPFVFTVVLWGFLWPSPWSVWPFLGALGVPIILAASIWKSDDSRGLHDRFAGTRVLIPR